MTIVTLGLYGIYWRFKAPKEIHEQFELLKEGRDDHIVWLVMGLVLPVLMLVYEWKIVDNVRYVRRRLDMQDNLTPGTFVGLRVAGQAMPIVAVIVFVLSPANLEPAWLAGVILVALAGVALQARAFYRLQTDINGIWEAWEHRLDDLTGPQDDEGPQGSPDPRPARNVRFPVEGP